MAEAIVARGVRVHNLKGIDVSIPTRRLVVVTGVSGSGKSSLAFDTLYAEGHRRYVESLSAYARQFLERMEKPAVDGVDGICPAVAIRQRTPSRNPRSTVATATEIHDHLRVLFARVGRTVCGSCGSEVTKDTAESVAQRLLGLPEESRVLVAFPVSAGGIPRRDLFERLLKRGFRRLLAGEEAVEIEGLEAAAAPGGDQMLVLVDRVSAREESRARLVDSLEAAFAEGGGRAVVRVVGGRELRFSEGFDCARCGRSFEEPQPRLFSFNNPYGACPTCHGFGNLIEVDQDLVIPDKERSLRQGAVEPWNKPHYKTALTELRRFARRRGISMDTPWSGLPEEHRRLVLEGDEEFQGVVGFFRWLETKKYKVQVRVFLSRYRGYQVCPACQGTRLRPEALGVHVGGLGIDAVCALSVRDALAFLASLPLEEADRVVAAKVVSELTRRLKYLTAVGLDYLTLDRPFASLSGGEAQRIALATALGTGLVGTLYVLDEPSIGLHPRDTNRLIEVLKALRDQGNTVLVVEHDRAIVKVADHIVDLGPGAGEQGGRVVFEGSFAELMSDGRSLTAKYLRGELQIPVPTRRRKGNGLALTVRGARAHNLKGIDARVPLGALTCVTGVSGSGKSTLVTDVICAALLHRQGRWDRPVGAHDGLEGASYVDEVVVVDQSPIGRTPRSNPVTYLKAFDGIRELFASTRDAHARGLGASDFSFNVPGGRCETCAGDGQVRVDMQFLADVSLVCEACGGRRYRPPVLEVRYRGRSIDQVLDMTVHEAVHFFSGHPAVIRRLKLFEEIGLGYLRLGQSATTLSGGEAQRIKLAAHLARKAGHRVLYVLDEPTTGLHLGDINELLGCFHRLLEAGATLLVIEHNMDVVKQADWVIDLGPEGGADGGRLVFQGTPEALAANGTGSLTARYLRAALAPPGRPAMAPA
ncbi:MAG TPA: excinuclease ABC subunit UvrA [Vicinamibacteria bacterium]|nr:excinuclease ABC subunit UvrA [Vicinamibacteria bacterium]